MENYAIACRSFLPCLVSTVAAKLPLSRRYMFFGSRGCRYVLAWPLIKASFFLGGALAIAHPVLTKDILLDDDVPEESWESWGKVVKGIQSAPTLFEDILDAEYAVLLATRARKWTNLGLLLVELEFEALVGMQWGLKWPDIMASVLVEWTRANPTKRALLSRAIPTLFPYSPGLAFETSRATFGMLVEGPGIPSLIGDPEDLDSSLFSLLKLHSRVSDIRFALMNVNQPKSGTKQELVYRYVEYASDMEEWDGWTLRRALIPFPDSVILRVCAQLGVEAEDADARVVLSEAWERKTLGGVSGVESEEVL